MKYSVLLAAAALFAGLRLAAADTVLEPNLPDPDKPVEVRVTTGDANKEVKVKVGEVIVVELDSYAADNYYSWTEQPGRSDSVLEAEGRESKLRDYAIGMVRVGDKTTFRYLVKAPGKTELTFGCGRPWEQGTPPVSSFSVKIVAEAADEKASPASDAKADAKAAPKTYEMTRDDNGKTLKVDDGTVLLVEGIHALNPALTAKIPDEAKYKIFINTIISISLDDHNCIPTSDNRLLRRIVRDCYKGAFTARETLAQWPLVRKAEDEWIYPYQENADVMFNSAYLVEFAVLRNHAEPILESVPKNCPEYAEAHRLLKFIHYFTPVPDNEIPATSLLREFVGGSSFTYPR